MKSGADEVLYASTGELVEESLGLVPNKAAAKKKTRRRKAKPKKRTLEYELYGGYESLLVRTALVRSEDYSPRRTPVIKQPYHVARLCRHMADYDQEHVVMLALNAAGRVMAIHETAIGGTSQVRMEVRHMVKLPLLVGVPSVIFVHNHPSGSPGPSQDDLHAWRALKEAMECVGLNLLDNVIVAYEGWFSKTEGMTQPWSAVEI